MKCAIPQLSVARRARVLRVLSAQIALDLFVRFKFAGNGCHCHIVDRIREQRVPRGCVAERELDRHFRNRHFFFLFQNGDQVIAHSLPWKNDRRTFNPLPVPADMALAAALRHALPALDDDTIMAILVSSDGVLTVRASVSFLRFSANHFF